MFISRLSLCGYKNIYEKSEVTLNRGLNILLGENGCGKTAVINALRCSYCVCGLLETSSSIVLGCTYFNR